MSDNCGYTQEDPNIIQFKMQQGSDDFQFWSGLRGPCFVPHVDTESGMLWFTNDAGLPNPEPIRIAGQDGQGVPAGGSAGQYLRKRTDEDYDTEWDSLEVATIAETKSFLGIV